MKFEEFVRSFPKNLPVISKESQKKAIETIDKETFERQLIAMQEPHLYTTTMADPVSFDTIHNKTHPQPDFYRKKLGCIVLAGGQATRLNSHQPKGVLPFELHTGKSLFAKIADKLKAFGRLYGSVPALAVMTSQHTDTVTRQHFLQNDNFGLKDVSFFVQPSLPLITMEGKIALDSSGNVLFGPDGNGSVFKTFSSSGLLQEWGNREIEAISIMIIDNPLLDPFHPDLFLPVFQGIAMTVGAIVRNDPFEKVGLFVRKNRKVTVVEYSEIEPSLQQAKKSDGSLLYGLANISFFVTTPTTIAVLNSITTKLHAAKKIVSGQDVWKSEYFIFDYLPYVDSIEVVPIDRTLYFAPIKDPQSFAEAQARIGTSYNEH